MNWITTKMPDAHWLTEARLKGTRVVVIACEYSATSQQGDDAIVVRPGHHAGAGAGLANVILRDKLYDAEYVKQLDRPADAGAHGHAQVPARREVFGGEPAELTNQTTVLADGESRTAARPHRHADPERDARGVGRLRLVGPAAAAPRR
jgi:nitrate reductase / nitrite oxidoreductase, alpha subunit